MKSGTHICMLKRKIISLFHLETKVGYLFITRKIVTRKAILAILKDLLVNLSARIFKNNAYI